LSLSQGVPKMVFEWRVCHLVWFVGQGKYGT
jgi:hypothetical protein